MKKFLSLVLALVMTMSLVTISAGATEYKDLTDKTEIQYEEAVAVLNRLGIITGYSDGSFQPKTELTRGAAAKIIVSLMIGSEAANNLVASSAPYTDVPVDHTFAGVISYCKTAGYINGYADGSFKPAGTLSGYAFSKMLLGALGYKGEYEGGFTGAGWTMNVARLGNSAGLFDRMSFKGNEAVNREQACQLALNTLKATLVEYTGGMTVTAGDASVVGGQQRSYVTSNQEFASHINNRKAGGNSNYDKDNWYTVEFGEEHFVDLRMKQERTERDDYGRPSNEWSYKKVTIGTYPVEPDFVYTTQVEHDVSSVSDATKVRALGLDGLKVNEGSAVDDEGHRYLVRPATLHVNGKDSSYSGTVGEIADLTDNGTRVEVYVSDTTADLITDIVVIKTQLMEVKRIGSDAVALDRIEPKNMSGGNTVAKPDSGWNQAAIHERIEDVEVDNDYFELLKGLKVEDVVAVVPLTTDGGSTYEVGKAYVPEVVEGKLTKATTYGRAADIRQTVAVTVGGTEYKVALWNKKLVDIDADKIKYTRDDIKLFLDEYGNALQAKGVGDTSEFMVIKDYYQSLENGKLVTYVNGWDTKGNEISLNLGKDGQTVYAYKTDYKPGDLVKYTNKDVDETADWKLTTDDVYTIDLTQDGGNYQIKASNNLIWLTTAGKCWITKDIKFLYVGFEDETNPDAESITVRNGVQNVTHPELDTFAGTNYKKAQACLNDDGEVEAVVVKTESNEAKTGNLLYVREAHGSYSVVDGKKVYGYTVSMLTDDGFVTSKEIYGDKDLEVGDFATYSLSTLEGFDPYYQVRQYSSVNKTTSVNAATVLRVVNEDKGIVQLTDYAERKTNIATDLSASLGVGDEYHKVRIDSRTEWLDPDRYEITSVKEMNESITAGNYPRIQFVYNDNKDNDGFRHVELVIITGTTRTATDNSSTPVDPTAFLVNFPAATSDDKWTIAGTSGATASGDQIAPGTSVTLTLTQKVAAATAAGGTLTADTSATPASGKFYIAGLPDSVTPTVTITQQGVVGDEGTPAKTEWKAVTYTAESYKKDDGTSVAKADVKVYGGTDYNADKADDSKFTAAIAGTKPDATEQGKLYVKDVAAGEWVKVTWADESYAWTDNTITATAPTKGTTMVLKDGQDIATATDGSFEAIGGTAPSNAEITKGLYAKVTTAAVPATPAQVAKITVEFTTPSGDDATDINITAIAVNPPTT